MLRKINLVILSLLAMSQLSFGQSKKETSSFGVKGNCGMCKVTIENAAKIKGVSKVNWNKETKEITVIYNPKKTTLSDIHQSIANAGYDTEDVVRNQQAYDSLHGCCQYDPNMVIGSNK